MGGPWTVGSWAGLVDLSKGIPAKTPRMFLRVKPEEGFAEFLPDDKGDAFSRAFDALH